MSAQRHPTYAARKRNTRISPRKLRLAADMIRGQNVQHATEILEFSVTKSSRIMGKVLANAISNAEDKNADIDNLTVSKVTVDKGLVLHRRKPSARGRMRGVYHHFSNVDLVLEDRGETLVAEGAKDDSPIKAAKATEGKQEKPEKQPEEKTERLEAKEIAEDGAEPASAKAQEDKGKEKEKD